MSELSIAILARLWFAPPSEVARLARFLGVFACVPETMSARVRLIGMIDARLRVEIDGRPHFIADSRAA